MKGRLRQNAQALRKSFKDKERPIKKTRLQFKEVESRLKRYYDAF
jgi:hypothetical protein